ncbi:MULTISPECIES: FHA domain-containing protein [unclassified Undibacterium]|uniref:FHA domain-containing protein n=1 Tax=unclassified Undibacterium TaxID=2630295 RepID=UPI002AC9C9E2|nr:MULTISPECIES: FHA domain-containing protein [unclassified Undibacterium]MEB0140552.1 FHA domain-containing protein [Undibacterium sp. CCC2.1]MEB0171780.1 FHA domain-containing protein [Undibacterium sp. CCC1.1]MEB0175596.1 FHA domain-containing protein [Undibacterium sp. CCC3.4]MEB0216704.1 FHA domain-containing protein [Undibacterium sp. 5I2]WPX44073.1 FHA domain-containing protein [Undibacterium sp. CCC3.4]
MAKIIVTFNGLIQQEVNITKSRMTVGRRPGNDIVIDHLTVSGQHAAIDTASSGSFVLDLGSTNGTMVNSQPVKKHLLQHDDVIDIGKYKLRFQVEKNAQITAIHPAAGAVKPSQQAKVRVMNGPNAGKELSVSKPVTTIGSPGTQVMAITRQAEQYMLRHVEGKQYPKLNGVLIGEQAQALKQGDIIDLIGTHMQFVLV